MAEVMSAEEKLRDALEYAIMIIESYQSDIENSHFEDGGAIYVSLEPMGFCQGKMYKDALARIRRKAGLE